VTRLEGDFASRCTGEQDAQDPSEYERIVVPGDATVCGTRIVVCVSKLGSLALVYAVTRALPSERMTPKPKVSWMARSGPFFWHLHGSSVHPGEVLASAVTA
jgi:hypothetical protein